MNTDQQSEILIEILKKKDAEIEWLRDALRWAAPYVKDDLRVKAAWTNARAATDAVRDAAWTTAWTAALSASRAATAAKAAEREWQKQEFLRVVAETE